MKDLSLNYRRIRIPKINTPLELGIVFMSLKVFLSGSVLIPYPENVDTLLTAISVFMLVISILLDRYPPHMLLLYAAITGISLYSVIQTGDFGFLITIITCLALRKHDLNRHLKLIFKFQLFMFVIHFLLSLLMGAIGSVPLAISSRGEMRYRFGFIHPNTFSIYLFNLLILWGWLHYESLTVRNIVSLGIISFVFTLFTRTRTSLLTTIFFCVFLLMSRSSRPAIRKVLKFISKWAAAGCGVCMLLFTHLFTAGSKYIWIIDKLLSGRIHLGAYAHSIYPYTLLGQKVNFETGYNEQWHLNGFTFDNIYNYLLMNQGFLWLILISLLFYFLVKKGGTKVCPFILAWSLYGMTEIHGLNGFLCFPIFLIVLLFRDQSVDSTRSEARSYNLE